MRNRLSVMLGWAWSYFTFKVGVRLITGVGADFDTTDPQGLSRRIHARAADDGGKTKTYGRLAAWAGLDLGDDIAGEVLRCPAPSALRSIMPDGCGISRFSFWATSERI